MRPAWSKILGGLDLTEVLKETTDGELKKWSAKRTIGAAVVATACAEISAGGITWEAVALCFVGVLPLTISNLPGNRLPKN